MASKSFYEKERMDMGNAYMKAIKKGKLFDLDRWKIDRERKKK